MRSIARVCLFVTSMALCASVLAAPCAGFIDLDDSSSFCWNVQWLRNRQITLGCATPNSYCPNDAVTRVQMAAFLHRLGRALEPWIEFVDQNPGPVDIQASSDNYVCQTPAYTLVPGDYPRRAIARGLVWGLVDAAVVWNADIWYSVDFGVTWFFASNYIPFNATLAAGATQGSTFARVDLDGGATIPNYYVFAIRVRESADGPNGTGNFTDLACHLMVEFGNRNGGFPPYDAGAVGSAGGRLGENRRP